MDETVNAAAETGVEAPGPKVEAEPGDVHAAERAAHPHAPYQDVRRLRADAEAVRKAFESGEFPYKTRLSEKVYLRHMELLQVELLKAQNWVKETGQRIVLLFEGRDAAGKGGTIKRFMEHLNPRGARVVARKSRPSASAASGISSATSSTCLRPARSFSSTAHGTIAPASSA